MHFCADHPHHLCRPEEQDYALPVRRQSGLLPVRLHCFHGLGGGGQPQAGAGSNRRPHLLGFKLYQQDMATKEACSVEPILGRYRLLEGVVMSYLTELMKSTATFGSSARGERKLRRDLVRFGHMLHSLGFVAATDGNLSVRLDADRVLVTPTGFSKGMMRPEDMVVVDLHGKKLSGAYSPSSEIVMHLTIYRMRPEIGRAVHAHPCTATGFASAGIALDEPLCSEIVITLGA